MNERSELGPPLEQLLGDGPVPVGWTEVAALLRRAGDVPPNGSPEPELLAALLAAATERPAGRVVARRGIALASVAVVVVLGAGSAAAAAGDLPNPVQSVVHDVVAVVGLDIPDGPPTTPGSQDGPGHGRSDDAPGRPATPGRPDDPGRADEAPGRLATPGKSERAPRSDPARQPPGRGGETGGEAPASAGPRGGGRGGAPADAAGGTPSPPSTTPSTPTAAPEVTVAADGSSRPARPAPGTDGHATGRSHAPQRGAGAAAAPADG